MTLSDQQSALAARLTQLATAQGALGRLVPGMHPKRLFDLPDEAYSGWYRQIPGCQEPHPELKLDWATAGQLKDSWQNALRLMRTARRKMVAMQEEMDWVVYSAYGLLPKNQPAVNLLGNLDPQPIDQIERPYRLLQNEMPPPAAWSEAQKLLWRERLQVIGTNPHIGRIEQPAYKRRWDEPFGDRDFLNAYEWWLREKAEWVLQHDHGGGPVELDDWARELRQDRRIVSAFEVALDIGNRSGNALYARDRLRGDYAGHLKRLIDEESVPDERQEFKPKHAKLRGIDPRRYLPNGVPRERFRSVTEQPGWYVWAGKDLWGGVRGDVWDA